MKPRAFAIAIGIAIALVGLVLAFIPTHATTSQSNFYNGHVTGSESTDCGGVFNPTNFSGSVHVNQNRQELITKCDDAVSSRTTIVWVLVGIGVLIAIGGAVIRPTKPATQPVI